MMSLLHLQRVTVFCIPNWPLTKDYSIFYNANMFLKKVLNVSQYSMTCSEEGFRVEFALSDWILESFFHWFFYILGKQSPGLAFQTRGFHNDLCNFDFGSWHRRWTQSDNVILETTAVKVIIWCPCCLMPTTTIVCVEPPVGFLLATWYDAFCHKYSKGKKNMETTMTKAGTTKRCRHRCRGCYHMLLFPPYHNFHMRGQKHQHTWTHF